MGFISESIADFYVSRKIICASEKEIYKYGIELILNAAINYLIIGFISLVVGSIVFAIEFLLTFCITRFFCGGYHAKKHYICRLTMVGIFLSVVFLANQLLFVPNTIIYIILIIAFLIIVQLAPVEHPNKPLNELQRRNNRNKGIISFVLFALLSVVLITISKLDGVIIAMSLLAVSILAIMGSLQRKERAK